LSRVASISKQLNRFFKLYLPAICAGDLGSDRPRFDLFGSKESKRRPVVVVYAGGDDLFVVGAWNQVLELAKDLHDAFASYTHDTLTFSAGVHLFPEKFPVAQMAILAGKLEEAAKQHKTDTKAKDSIALFGDMSSHCYFWEELDAVVKILRETFLPYLKQENGRLVPKSVDHADQVPIVETAWLYRFLALLDNPDNPDNPDEINLARLSYLIARSRRPDDEKLNERLSKLRDWAICPAQRKALRTSITWLVYLLREDQGQSWSKLSSQEH
ncbi:MAG: hypothetical protein HY692_05640, partial [Cyanobacteria bacterium NC_groundwater_1444_Ag_S-0.65um_54_12]|nr:hypothetical protein [Cyanobacteria bacterium NC_groundwater_1444_Ag_S-0.65um_54_12]